MAKFNGYTPPSKMAGKMGGGMPNMQELMKQAQKMQEEVTTAKEELEEARVEGNSAGGACKVTLSGSKKLVGIKLDGAIVDPDDTEMLEDLIVAAYNEAYSKAEELEKEKMPQGMGGLL